MKNFRYYTLLFSLLLILSSCKSDDGGDSVDNEPDPNAENLLALGASSADLLSDSNYNSLVVEFVFAEGFRPRQETLDVFRTFLNDRINKPGGITFVETVIDPPPGAPYNAEEIRNIEDANRTQFTEGNKIAVYIFFSNGSSFGDTQTSVTLGTAYRNTSIVVYEKTLRDISIDNPDFDLGVLQSITLNHEFGHILGLTNILQDDIHTNHEDEFHPKHCVVEECLMYFEAQTATKESIGRMMSRDGVVELDALCIADLQAKGGK